jgi:hypothetical protein
MPEEEAKLFSILGYSKPEEFSVVEVPLPKLRENDVLVCERRKGILKRWLTQANSSR